MSGEPTPSQMGGLLLMALRVRSGKPSTRSPARCRRKYAARCCGSGKAPADAVDVVGTGGHSSGSVGVGPAAPSSSRAPACQSPSMATAHRWPPRSNAPDVPSTPRRQDRPHPPTGSAAAWPRPALGFMFSACASSGDEERWPPPGRTLRRPIFNLRRPAVNPAGVKPADRQRVHQTLEQPRWRRC